MGAWLLCSAQTRRPLHLYHSLPRLLEKSSHLVTRQVGRARESALGRRTHQALEQTHTFGTAHGGWIHGCSISRRRPNAGNLDDHDCQGAKARMKFIVAQIGARRGYAVPAILE